LLLWKAEREEMNVLNPSTLHRVFRVDQLKVEVHANRQHMGEAAARAVAQTIQTIGIDLNAHEWIPMIFASAPSQDEFLTALAKEPNLDWERVAAFHMDEYIGLPPNAPQSFGKYLRQRLFDQVRPGLIHYLDGNNPNLAEEIGRYSKLLQAYPTRITCAGIGENGHLAFNDPPLADFKDEALLRVVDLASRSRQQQVNDGCFDHVEDVPKRALTLTIPVLISSANFTCVVPGRSKAEAVRRMLTGPITADCPASILRQHPNATLYLDLESADLIE
jgi:glucosamine-6-phosphate deaminase